MMRLLTNLAGLRAGAGGWQRAPATAPAVPAGVRVYAIGDIHGERRLLDRLLALIAEDIERAAGLTPVAVFLGDYVDRGADSRGVLERLSGDPLGGVSCRFLSGNHEAAMLDFLDNPAANADWLRFGGAETLVSYGIQASIGIADPARCRSLGAQLAANLPDHHRRFLHRLETFVVLGDYAFVHAGILPGRRLHRQRREHLLWIREPFLSSAKDHEKVIVHGHTVAERPELRPNRISVDTGAYATGILTALALSGTEQRFLQAD